MLISSMISLRGVIYWLPALIVFIVFLIAMIQFAQEEVSLKKGTSIILVSSVYIFFFVGLLYLVLQNENLARIIDQIGFRLLVTLVLYASSSISVIVSMIILFIVHGNKVGFENIELKLYKVKNNKYENAKMI